MKREPWQAPRTAYLLTAATAEKDQQGGDAIWHGLDDRGQAGVLAALGAQARVTLRHASERRGGSLIADMDLTSLMLEVCRESLQVLFALIEDRPWEPPPCPHCRKKVAGGLAALIVNLSLELGISAEGIAHNCRRTAAKVAAGR